MRFFDRYKNQSVINSDRFDRRRFSQLYDMSHGLQNLNKHDKAFPTFESLLGDIWAALYKMRPQLNEFNETLDELKTNHSLMERIMKDEKFEDYRKYTRLDELSSALATTSFGEKTKEWLENQRRENEKLNEQMNDLLALQQQLEKQEILNGAGQANQQLQDDFQQAMGNIHQEVNKQIQQNGGELSKNLSEAINETKSTKENIKKLLGGTKAGSGDAELKKLPLKDQLDLAEKIAAQKHMKFIAEWAGRFKRIARLKQKSVYTSSIQRSGVNLGNNIEKLLPSEQALYSHKSTRIDFLRRYTEGQTMEFETKAKESLGKGPIVLCLDQSASMRHMDYESKGFVLALMSIARKQKRDFCYIPFANGCKSYRYPKGKITTSEMIKLSKDFLDGGTDFVNPLSQCV